MNLSEIYQGAERLINHLIRREMIAQGHHLTGAMEDSLQGKTTKDTLEGFAVYYTKFVEEGVPASSASMKQFPFVVRYFQKRGLSEKEAKGAAAATPKLTNDPLNPMNYLVTIWTNYCDPNFSPSCGKCLSRLIEDFKQLQPLLIQFEKEANFLKTV